MLPSIKQPLSPENGEHYLTRAEVTGTWHHLTLEATRWTNKIIPENYLREIWNRLDLEFCESLGDSKMTVCSLKSPWIHLLFQYLRFISLVHPMKLLPYYGSNPCPKFSRWKSTAYCQSCSEAWAGVKVSGHWALCWSLQRIHWKFIQAFGMF